MSDTISRQAAIDEIKALYEWHEIVTEDRAIDHFKRLPSAQPEQRWIPCSERLPEESGKYLITANDGIHKRTTFAKYQHRHKTWEMTGRMAFWKVLAWMPLPFPYKEEDA